MSEPTEPMVVDADPLFKRGDLAVWQLADIPVGTTRFLASRDVDSAISSATRYPPLIHTEACKRNPDRMFAVAAVPWRSLQPRRPVPRGRTSMTAQQWGRQRDDDGVCFICKADDSMWCDTVAHAQKRRLAVPFLRGPWSEALLEPSQPFRAVSVQPDRVSAAYVEAMGASTGEHVIRRNTSDLARAAWAAELRAKVQASEAADRERERARILVDPYFESWE